LRGGFLWTLLHVLPTFQYDRRQSFRGWLRTVTLNNWRKLRKKRAQKVLGEQDRDLGAVVEEAVSQQRPR
jgi:DNA-directed RNA polymerase specialized sigma24 family protein